MNLLKLTICNNFKLLQIVVAKYPKREIYEYIKGQPMISPLLNVRPKTEAVYPTKGF